MRCEALSLDLDETLIDYSVSTLRGLEAIGGQRSDLPRWREVSSRSEVALDEGALSAEQFDRERILRFHDACFGRLLSESELTDLAAARRASVLDSVTVFPDAIQMLDTIQRLGLKCIAVSNSYAALREGIVQRLGLTKYFVHMKFCGDGIDRKPHRNAFRDGLRVVGCSPAHVLHIGDEVLADVLGARNAGVKGAHLNRSGGDCRHIAPCLSSLDISLKQHNGATLVQFSSGFAFSAASPVGNAVIAQQTKERCQ